MDLSQTRRNRQSSTKPIDGGAEGQDSALLRHIFTQYNTGTEISNLAPGSASVFDRTAGQSLPFTAEFENDLNDAVYLDTFGGFLAPSDLPISTAYDLSNATSEQGEPLLDRNLDDFSIATSDSFSGIFTPVISENCSDNRAPPNPSTRTESCAEKNKTCMVSATQILKSLHISPTACLCSTGNTSGLRQPRMTDSVLTGNRDAVLSASKMLKCTCSLRPQVQLVLCIICDKLISWYRAMIRSDHDGSDVSQSKLPSVTNGIRNDKDQAERVLHQPITIGDHCLDVALECKIRAQVILGELQRLETLVETLSKRIWEGNGGASASRSGRKVFTADSRSPILPEEPGLTEVIHGRLAAFLRRQLQAAKTELATVLGDDQCLAQAARASQAG